MPSPEQDRRLTQERLEHRLGPTLQRLLGQVQDETGYPVLVGLAPNDIHGTYAHITYATNERPNHGIFVTAEAISFLDYLVAHECGHVLRLFQVPDSQRLLGFIDEEHVKRAAELLVPQVRKRWGAVTLATAEKLALVYQRGVVGQVVNFPTDLRIETWIRNEC